MQPLLTICVPLLIGAGVTGWLFALSERCRRYAMYERFRAENRKRRQAESGFRERTSDLRTMDAGLYRLDRRYQVLGAWALEEGRPIDEIAVEQNEIVRSRLLIDRWFREPGAAAVGSRLEQRWRRNGTSDE